MEKGPRTYDLGSLIFDPEEYVCGMPIEKLMLYKVQILDLKENYDRGAAITYINSNFTSNKHLSLTLLNGMDDEKIKSFLDELLVHVNSEIKSRKS